MHPHGRHIVAPEHNHRPAVVARVWPPLPARRANHQRKCRRLCAWSRAARKITYAEMESSCLCVCVCARACVRPCAVVLDGEWRSVPATTNMTKGKTAAPGVQWCGGASLCVQFAPAPLPPAPRDITADAWRQPCHGHQESVCADTRPDGVIRHEVRALGQWMCLAFVALVTAARIGSTGHGSRSMTSARPCPVYLPSPLIPCGPLSEVGACAALQEHTGHAL